MIIADDPAYCVAPRDSSSSMVRRMVLVDAQGKIIAVNKDWAALAEETGTALKYVGPGVNYLEVCRRASVSCAASRKAIIGIHEVLREETSFFALDYSCHTSRGLAYFRMDVTPITFGDARVAIAHTDTTDLQISKEKDFKRLRQFSRRLINAQEDERQRISQEIHDDLGNRLALMSLSIRQLMGQSSRNLDSRANELGKLLDGITDLATALRNLSHGLHPAPLRYLGIPAALKSLDEGFKKTYGIQMDVRVPAEMPRLPDDVELCIFRVTQECLQNVTKHAGADKVSVVLEHTPREIRLTISDTGRGFHQAEAIQKGGLGLLSMEERALSVGGCLTMKSSPGAGTAVRLTIPMRKNSAVFRAR